MLSSNAKTRRHVCSWHVYPCVCNANVSIELKVCMCINKTWNHMRLLPFEVPQFLKLQHIRVRLHENILIKHGHATDQTEGLNERMVTLVVNVAWQAQQNLKTKLPHLTNNATFATRNSLTKRCRKLLSEKTGCKTNRKLTLVIQRLPYRYS